MDREVTKQKTLVFGFCRQFLPMGSFTGKSGSSLVAVLFQCYFHDLGKVSDFLFCPRNRQNSKWGMKDPLGSTVPLSATRRARRGAGMPVGKGGRDLLYICDSDLAHDKWFN